MSQNKKKTRARSSRRNEGTLYPSQDVITALHWLPDFKEVWDQYGDLRSRIQGALFCDGCSCQSPFQIENAIVMDPEKPDPVKVVGANWIHADAHGIMTKDIFFEDLSKCIGELADMIYKDQNPFQPVRIYKDAENAYGVGYFDWRGDDYPFDIRTITQFGTWEFTTDKGEFVNSAGLRFWIATLVLPKKEDADVHVGKDMAKAMFGDD